MSHRSNTFRFASLPSLLFSMRMSTMKMSLFLCVLTVGVLGSSIAQAATVSWSSTPYTVNGGSGENLDTGLFDTSGIQVLAENLGGGALTFDGIDFTVPTLNFASPYSLYHAGLSGGGNTDLAKYGTYDAPLSPKTVTLTGLTSGNRYRIQALVADSRPHVNGNYVEFDGVYQGIHANGILNDTWGNALLVTGTFTADATTQGFTTEVFTSADESIGGQLNALLLHQVTLPEPSTFVLLSLGVIGLISRRRRNR